MLNLIFNNVGQGDSIILEWKDDGGLNKIGIVDCNIYNGQNPVLAHIKEKKYSSIEFIILTHPHIDHFSGLRQLLNFCEDNKITINNFLHTCSQVPDYLRSASRSNKGERELINLFTTIKKLHKLKPIIKYQSYITSDNKDLQLNSRISIAFLAPSVEEKENYITGVKTFDEEDPNNNPNANWLCTVLKIYTEDWYILLTSDVEKSVLKKLGIKYSYLFDRYLFLGQSPHHGAKNNHYNSFWKHRKNREEIPIVFSVGQNRYNHPSMDAINTFKRFNYTIYSTNQVGNLSYLTNDKKIESREINSYLDFVSYIQSDQNSDSKLNGDQTFTISKDKIIYVEN